MNILVDKEKCGIYKIRNILNNKCYIGSTTGVLKNRCITHRCHLRYNRHSNKHLQSSWNKYGESKFEFSKIELCLPNQCIEKEQYYIDNLNPEYNILKFAGSTLGYKHTKKAKNKISKAFKGKLHPAYSGEYIFYHPNHNYIIEGRSDFAERYNLKKIRIYKLCNNTFHQYKGWICLGKYYLNFIFPKNIKEIYENKLNHDKPLYAFYHKTYGKIILPLNKFCNKFNFKWREIGGLYNGTRYSAKNWICFGKCNKNFTFPNNLNEIYKMRIEKNPYNKKLKNKKASFINKSGEIFNGTLKEFSKKYNLTFSCVTRIYNKRRNKYQGWSLKNVD